MNKFEQPNYYAVIPASVRYDKRLTPLERLLYGELTCLSNKEGYCWASNAYFAKIYDKHLKSISRCINNLVKYNYIQVTVDQDNGNLRKIVVNKDIPIHTSADTPINTNVDTFHTSADTPIHTNVDTPIHINVEHNSTSINNTREEYKTPYSPPKLENEGCSFQNEPETSESESDLANKISKHEEKAESAKRLKTNFEIFYAAYPKKRAPENALRAWLKIKPDNGLLQTMLEAIKKQQSSAEWKKDGGQYIPYPATWLNQKRWLDEIGGNGQDYRLINKTNFYDESYTVEDAVEEYHQLCKGNGIEPDKDYEAELLGGKNG